MRIPVELKLPNMVLGNPLEAPKAPLQFDPNSAKPTQANRQLAPEAAPSVTSEAPKTSLVTYLDPSSSQPRLAIPLAGAAKPTLKTGNGGPSGAANGGVAAPGDGNDLLVVGVDPGPAGSVVALGPGNRWGEFSISPAGGQPGSPGGSPNGIVGGGTGGTGSGGDGSTGVGPGGGGGGGAASGKSGCYQHQRKWCGLRFFGCARIDSPYECTVYPVPAAVLPKVRKSGFSSFRLGQLVAVVSLSIALLAAARYIRSFCRDARKN